MDKRKWVKDAFFGYWRYCEALKECEKQMQDVDMPAPGGTNYSAAGGRASGNGQERKVLAYIEKREEIQARMNVALAKIDTVSKTIRHFAIEETAKGKLHRKYIDCRFIKGMGYQRAAIECGITDRTGAFWLTEIFEVAVAIAEIEGNFH